MGGDEIDVLDANENIIAQYGTGIATNGQTLSMRNDVTNYLALRAYAGGTPSAFSTIIAVPPFVPCVGLSYFNDPDKGPTTILTVANPPLLPGMPAPTGLLVLGSSNLLGNWQPLSNAAYQDPAQGPSL